MPPHKIDSLADDVKALVLVLQNSGLMARIDELVARNKALLARIAKPDAAVSNRNKTVSLLDHLSAVARSSVSAAALPARYPASYSADRLLYDQSSTFGQWLRLICL